MSLVQGVDDKIIAFEWNNMRGIVRGNLGSPMNCVELEVNGEAIRSGFRSMFQFRVNNELRRCQIIFGSSRYNLNVQNINATVSTPPQSLRACFTLQVLCQDTIGAIGFQLQITNMGTRIDANLTAFGQRFTGRYDIYSIIGYQVMEPVLVKNRPGYTLEMNFAPQLGTMQFNEIRTPQGATRFVSGLINHPAPRVIQDRGATVTTLSPCSPFAPVETYTEGNMVVYGTRQIKNVINMDEDDSSSDEVDSSLTTVDSSDDSSSSWGW